MSKVYLRGGSYQAQSLIAGVQRCLNLYAEAMPRMQGEQQDQQSANVITGFLPKESYTYYPTPGLVNLGGTIKPLHAKFFPTSDVELSRGVSLGACISQFKWKNTYLTGNYPDAHASEPDMYGNLVLNSFPGYQAYGFRPSDGALLWNIQISDLVTMINSWLASEWSAPPIYAANYGNVLYVAPICGGQYLLAHFQPEGSSSSFNYWWCLLRPNPTGRPTFVAGVYFSGLLNSPYLGRLNKVTVAGGQSTSDPILYIGAFAVAGTHSEITVLPSVDQIIGKTYNLDSFGAIQPITTPGLINNQTYYPIGTLNLSTNFFLQTGGQSEGNPNTQGGFCLPGPNNHTNLYIYLNRLEMDWAQQGLSNSNPEAAILQPTYPLGAMLKIQLGLVQWTNIAGATATPMYTVDNANWVDGTGASVLPFTDEYSNIRTHTAGATYDAYMPKPGLLKNVGDGTWVVGMTMNGMESITGLSLTTAKYQALRPFVYYPGLEKFVQGVAGGCWVYQYKDLDPTALHFYDDNEQIFWIDPVTGYLNMYGVAVGGTYTYVYMSTYSTITLP